MAPNTIAVTYIGPHDAVEIAATGVIVERGETVEVDADLAGHAPKLKADGTPAQSDLGSGLLAQTASWEPGKKSAVKTEDKDGD